MTNRLLAGAALIAAPMALAHPAFAAAPAKTFGSPIAVSDSVTIDPMMDARLRWENVDTPAKGADAVTLRLRSGLAHGGRGGSSLGLPGRRRRWRGTLEKVRSGEQDGSHQNESQQESFLHRELFLLWRTPVRRSATF